MFSKIEGCLFDNRIAAQYTPQVPLEAASGHKPLDPKLFFWICLGPLLLLSAFTIGILKFYLFALSSNEWIWWLGLASSIIFGLFITRLTMKETIFLIDEANTSLQAKEKQLSSLRSNLANVEFALKKQLESEKKERLLLSEKWELSKIALEPLPLLENRVKELESFHKQLNSQLAEKTETLLQAQIELLQKEEEAVSHKKIIQEKETIESRVKELEAVHKQLKNQLAEKTETLQLTRIDLFQKEGESIALKKAFQEKELEFEKELIEDLRLIIQECKELEEEKELLQDLVTTNLNSGLLSSSKLRTRAKSKSQSSKKRTTDTESMAAS
jgi:hypothetical protein